MRQIGIGEDLAFYCMNQCRDTPRHDFSKNCWIIGIVSLGIIFRMIDLLGDTSLWLDEAMLALNICERSFWGLLSPLEWHQVAPISFLWGTKCCVSFFGISNITLKFLPFFAGASLPLLAYLAVHQETRNDLAASITAFILAIAPSFVYYSTEFKQYMMEPFIGLAMVICKLHRVETYATFRRSLLSYAIFCLSLSLSNYTFFYCAGLVGVLLINQKAYRRPQTIRYDIIAQGFYIGTILVYYFFVIRQHPARAFMQQYWQNAGGFFIVTPGHVITSLKTIYWNIDRILIYGFGVTTTYPVYGLAGIGLAIGMKRWRELTFFFTISVMAHLALNLFRIYPIDIRLFLPGLLCIAIFSAFTITTALEYVKLRWIKTVIIIIGVFFFVPQGMKLRMTFAPDFKNGMELTLKDVQALAGQDIPIYVHFWAIPTFEFYTHYQQFNFSNPVIYGRSYGMTLDQKTGILLPAQQLTLQEEINHLAEKYETLRLLCSDIANDEFEQLCVELKKHGNIRVNHKYYKRSVQASYNTFSTIIEFHRSTDN